MNYIYIIREREFLRLDEDVYKLGRTTQRNLKRLMQHSKGSELLFQSMCADCNHVELDIREIFIRNYTQRDDYGRKYFQGCVYEMISDICAYLLEHIDGNIAREIDLTETDSDESESEDEDEDDDEDEDEDDDEDEDEDDDEEEEEEDEDEEEELREDEILYFDAQMDTDMNEYFEIESILGHKNIRALGNGAEFLVKWKGYSNLENTTEPWNELKHSSAMFEYITRFAPSTKWTAVRAALFADIRASDDMDMKRTLDLFLLR